MGVRVWLLERAQGRTIFFAFSHSAGIRSHTSASFTKKSTFAAPKQHFCVNNLCSFDIALVYFAASITIAGVLRACSREGVRQRVHYHTIGQVCVFFPNCLSLYTVFFFFSLFLPACLMMPESRLRSWMIPPYIRLCSELFIGIAGLTCGGLVITLPALTGPWGAGH